MMSREKILDKILDNYLTRLVFYYNFEVETYTDYIYKIYKQDSKLDLELYIMKSLLLLYHGMKLKYLVDLPKENLEEEFKYV